MKNLVALLFMISVLIVSAFPFKCLYCELINDIYDDSVVERDEQRIITYWHCIYYKGHNTTCKEHFADEPRCPLSQKLAWMSQKHLECCLTDLCYDYKVRYFEKSEHGQIILIQPYKMFCILV
ncbi:uncharacterized protein ACNLHF_003098 [Anomaloglossus baeobatrachus]